MTIYTVREDGFETDDIDTVVDHCIDGEYHRDDDIEDWVNDIYSSYNIGGYLYSAYDVLDRFNDLEDFLNEYCESSDKSDADEARWELRHATDGDQVNIQSYTVDVRIEDDATATAPEHHPAESNMDMLENLRQSVEQIRSYSEEVKRQDESMLQSYLDLFQAM